ncbi:MAG: uracil permease [Oligoflexia bacterium]|nr:uracil permease [Oligoflexia bacterium]
MDQYFSKFKSQQKLNFSVIDVESRVPIIKGIPLSLQHLFAMFGASILVPSLFHIDPSIVLLMNGVGTLLYLFLCKGKIPAFLGSSFAFIAPVFAVLGADQNLWAINYPKVLGGFIVSGLIFMATAMIIRYFGTKWISILIPPAAMGPIVALIGLELASVATNMSGLMGNGNGSDYKSIGISMFTLAVVIFSSLFLRGFLSTIPILIGIIAGYVLAYSLGMVNFSAIETAPLLKFPTTYWPKFQMSAVLIIIPAALVVISEHIGHLIVTGNIVGRDLTKDPGLHRSLSGDGISTMLSGFMGSVPTTTYGENIGVMAVTKVYSVWVIGGAAVISIVLAFSGTLSMLIQTIPTPVMGGVCILLFGIIASSGIRMLVESKVDYSQSYNLIVTALVFVTGVSGVSMNIGSVPLKGMSLATVVAIAFNFSLYVIFKFKSYVKN